MYSCHCEIPIFNILYLTLSGIHIPGYSQYFTSAISQIRYCHQHEVLHADGSNWFHADSHEYVSETHHHHDNKTGIPEIHILSLILVFYEEQFLIYEKNWCLFWMTAIFNIAKNGCCINIPGCFHQNSEIVWYQGHMCQITCVCPALTNCASTVWRCHQITRPETR